MAAAVLPSVQRSHQRNVRRTARLESRLFTTSSSEICKRTTLSLVATNQPAACLQSAADLLFKAL